MANDFEQNVMNTQVGGETPVQVENPPKNMRQVETPVSQPQAPAEVPTPQAQPQQQVQQPVEEVVKPIRSDINHEFIGKLYDYTKNYTKDILKKDFDLSYEDYVGKNFADDKTAGAYYEKLIRASAYKPLPVNIGGFKGYMGNLYKPNEVKDVSSFVRTPFTEKLPKDDIERAAEQTINNVSQKYGLGEEIAAAGTQIEQPVITSQEKPMIQQLTEEMRAEKPAQIDDQLRKSEEDLTLKTWAERKPVEGIAPIVDKATLPEFKLDFNDPYNYNKWAAKTASAMQMTDEEVSNYGQNPFFKYKQADLDKPLVDWRKQLPQDYNSVQFWNTVGNNLEDIENNSVDVYQNVRELNKLPAQTEKIFNDYSKYLANTNPEYYKSIVDIRNIEDQKRVSGQQIEEASAGESVSKYFEDAFNFLKTGKKPSTDFLGQAKKGNVFDGTKIYLDVEEAFNHQKNVIYGDFLNGKSSGEDTKKALQALELTKEKVYKLNPVLAERRTKEQIKEIDKNIKQLEADIKESKFTQENPFLSVWYPTIQGAKEGGKAIVNDFAETINLVTGSPSILTSQMQQMAAPETLPTSLQGSIIDENGINFSRLMNQVSNTTVQMGGLLIGSKGLGAAGKTAKGLSGLEDIVSVSNKLENASTMFATSFAQSYDDYYNSGLEALKGQGYSDQAAELGAHDYALSSASLMSALETIVPLPFASKLNSKITSDYQALIKDGVNPYMARVKAFGANSKNIGNEILKQYGEEALQEVGDKINNAIFNERAGANLMDADMTVKGFGDLALVTAGSTLLMGAGRGNLYNSPLTKKASIWEATQNIDKFEAEIDRLSKDGQVLPGTAKSMKEAVRDVKSNIEGLPSAKNLTDKQKLDLGLLIYEKKKLEEQIQGGYVDEIFAEEKTKEIEGKKKKLNDKILEVYNQYEDRGRIKAEEKKINEERQEAQKYAATQLAETRARVLKNVEDLESEEAIINAKVPGEVISAEETITEVKPKTQEDAKTIRSNEGQFQEEGNVLEGSQDQGGQNLQLETPEKPGDQESGLSEKGTVGKKTIGENNNISVTENTRKFLDEYDFLKSKEDANDKTFSPTSKYRRKIPIKGTGDKASAKVSDALPLAEKEVRTALKREGYSDEDINIILDKSRKKEIIVNSPRETGTRKEATKAVYKQRKTETPVVKKKDVQGKTTEVAPGKKERIYSNEQANQIAKNQAEYKRQLDDIERDRTALREEADRSDNPEYKKGLNAIENALTDPNIKEPKDLKIGNEIFGSWLLNAKANERLTSVEYNNLKDQFSDLKDKFGKKEKLKTNIEKTKEALQKLADLKFVGTKVVGMNIFTVPINMPIALVKASAKVMLKAINTYQGLVDYNKVGDEAVKAMRKSKWFQNLSPKEKSAINKYIKEMEPFEAMITIIDEAARDYGTTGEKIAKEITKKENKKAAEKIADAKVQRKGAKREQVKETKKEIRTEKQRKDIEKKTVKTATNLRSSLRKKMKSDILSIEDKDMLGFLTSIDPRELFKAGGQEAVDEYSNIAEKTLNEITPLKFKPGTTKLVAPQRTVSNQAISNYVEKTQALLDKYAFNEFKRKNSVRIEAMQNLGVLDMNPTRSDVEAAFEKYNLLDNTTEEELKEAARKSPKIANKLKEMEIQVTEDISRLKKKLDEGSFQEMSKEDQKIIENITNLDVPRLSQAQLLKAAYTINNIIVNKDGGMSGSGQIEAIAISHQADKIVDEILKKHNLKTLRDLRESFHNVNVKSNPQVFKAIALTNEVAAEIQEALKIQDLNSGYSNVMNDVSKVFDQKVKKLKKQYGRKILLNPENQIRQGMYATILQWQGDNVQDKDAWFEENKELLEKDIEQKKQAGKFKEEVAIEEKIFNELFKDATSMEEVQAKMQSKYAGDKAMVDLVQSVFESNKKSFERASRVYANEEVDFWNNYTHRKWKENVDNKWQQFDPINKDSNIAKMLSGKHVNRKSSKSTISRTEQWPDEKKVLNLDFFNTQSRMIHESFYQAATLGTRYAIKEIMENPTIKKQLGEGSHKIIKKRLIDTINHQMGATQQDMQTKKEVKKIVNMLVRWQTAKALAGLSQAPLQFGTALTGAIFKNPAYIGSTISNIFTNTKDTDLFKYSNMKSRANAYYEGGIENLKRVEDSPIKNKLLKALDGMDRFTAGGAELALKPLQFGDFTAAKAAWMSYYKRKWKKDNPGQRFNWDQHFKSPDKIASAYADQLVQTSMNVNDMAVAGNFFRNQDFGRKMLRTITSPFSSFSVNQDYRLLDAFRNLSSLNKEAREEAVFDVGSIIAEQVTWQIIKAAIGSFMAYGAANFLPSLFGGGDDEEREIKKKKLENVFTKEFINKSLINAFVDIIPLAGILPPSSINFVEATGKRGANSLLEEWFGEEYKYTLPVKGLTLYPDTNFEPDVYTGFIFESLGIIGSAAYDLFHTGKIANVLWNGYKDPNGNEVELTTYQRNILTARLLSNLLSFSTGFSNKEWSNMLRYNEYEVKSQLRKGKSGGSSTSSGVSSRRIGGGTRVSSRRL